jgi:hypothetical protein
MATHKFRLQDCSKGILLNAEKNSHFFRKHPCGCVTAASRFSEIAELRSA